MRQETLLVSAIVLLDNEDLFLDDTIRSIQDQSYQPLEIILIDSRAQGYGLEVVKQFAGIRYYHQPGHNKASCINLGIQLARENLIAFLDAGDMWTNHALANQINQVEDHPEAEIVQGLINNVSRISKYPNQIKKFALTYSFINPGSLIFRRSVFNRLGMFDEALGASAEIDWFLRAWEMNIVKVESDETTLFKRQHNSQEFTPSSRVRLFSAIRKRISRCKGEINQLAASRQSSAEAISYIGDPLCELKTSLESFTIISDDCWSYGPYMDFELKYATPFIDIRIEPPCYLELLKDLRGYVESPLIFEKTSKHKNINSWREKRKLSFPIALLKDKVELLFVHETDEEACRHKWERRVKRINWNNLFIKFRENPWDSREEYLTEFNQLPYKHKVCFTLKDYPDFSWAVLAPDYFKAIEEGGNIYNSTKKYFDVLNWIKKACGPNSAGYKIDS